MRKILGILVVLVLMFASIGSASASGPQVPKTDKAHVPAVSPNNTAPVPPSGGGGVGIEACSNSVLGINKNPLSYFSWSQVTQLQACSSITVKVYNIGTDTVEHGHPLPAVAGSRATAPASGKASATAAGRRSPGRSHPSCPRRRESRSGPPLRCSASPAGAGRRCRCAGTHRTAHS
jgi:hypothetical protein